MSTDGPKTVKYCNICDQNDDIFLFELLIYYSKYNQPTVCNKRGVLLLPVHSCLIKFVQNRICYIGKLLEIPDLLMAIEILAVDITVRLRYNSASILQNTPNRTP